MKANCPKMEDGITNKYPDAVVLRYAQDYISHFRVRTKLQAKAGKPHPYPSMEEDARLWRKKYNHKVGSWGRHGAIPAHKVSEDNMLMDIDSDVVNVVPLAILVSEGRAQQMGGGAHEGLGH